MRRLCTLLAAFAALLVGCSADGGPVGSGISSSIGGNIVGVDQNVSTTDSGGGATLPAVTVSIDQHPGISTTTDSDGTFELDGDFSGQITLRFRTGQIVATQALDIPAGSTTVLQDITVRPQRIDLGGARQLGFFGHIRLVDCTDGTLLVDDRRSIANQFLVHLLPQTVISTADGQPLQCSDLHDGDPIGIQGLIRLSDLTIDAVGITVAPPPPGAPQPVQQLRFVGTAAFINCQLGLLVREVSGTVRINILPSTVITDDQQQPLPCTAIQVGDHIDGQGSIKIRRPDVVDAISMVVTPAP